LPLAFSGAVLHAGDYCRFLQVVTPGNNTLPVAQGCQFDLTKPADVFATDRSNYSVSKVVGDAQMGVRGPADAKVMIVCRLPPRAQFWVWISSDGNWNISSIQDVHHPQDLVSAQEEASMRQYVKVGALNHVQFRCDGGENSAQISLALNVNDHQFAALSVPMPSTETPLAKPATPWFVDLGARLTSTGELVGTVAKVMLYDKE
jgi:hypothetical protein